MKTKNTLFEIATFYPNIQFKNPKFEPTNEFIKDIELDSRRLATFLNSLDINPTIEIETNLINQYLINFSFTSDYITVNFTLPHILNE